MIVFLDLLCVENFLMSYMESLRCLSRELNYFLGFQIKQMENETFINHTKYYLKLLKKYDMNNSKTVSTPMALNILIDKDENGVKTEITKYRGIIRSLIYLTTSRPDIIYSVCMCAQISSPT